MRIMTKTIEEATKGLIDSLKQACSSHGLGNSGNEYKIIVQVFLYKYFNLNSAVEDFGIAA